MDISLQRFKRLTFLIALLAIPLIGFSQSALKQEKTGFRNMPVKIWAQDISGQGLVLRSNPRFGQIIDNIPGSPGSNGVDTLVYLPNPNFVGKDEFDFEHFANFPQVVGLGLLLTTVEITIVPSYVEAQHDYMVMTEGESATLRVISNDSVTHGALTIDPVFPVVNHGTVSVGAEVGTVDFTPDAGFTGLADFNYIACDTVGTCATGTATVYVNRPGVVFNDAIRLGTGQNTAKAIPMPFKVTSVDNPNVKIESSQYAVIYEPGFNFTGTAEFTVFGENGNQRRVALDVIERPVSTLSLAVEDVVYAALGESVDINVLANDKFTGISRIQFLNASGGEISGYDSPADGDITFTPDENFRGVAKILYRVFDSGFEAHLGQAFIVYDRNNFGPNVRDYEYTFRLNPNQTKVIEYEAPISDYRLSPTEGFDNVVGLISALTDKAVLYEAPEEAPATDQFEISYCVPANSSNCQQIKIRIEVVNEQVDDCIDDCVYPGDLNKDGIVNNADLLPLGLYIGEKGPARNTPSTRFVGQEATDWDMSFAEDAPVNLKHYDADGDGVITALDAQAIQQNYGAVRQLVPGSIPALSKGISLLPNRVTPSQDEIALGEAIPAGSLIEFDIVLGDEDNQELDLYGFTFPLKLSGRSLIDPESFQFTFNNDSWAALNAPTINIAQDVSAENSDQVQLDLAFTRTSGVPVSGFKEIGKLSFVVIGDVDGFKLPDEEVNLRIEIGQAYAIDGTGKYYQYDAEQEFDLPITFAPAEQDLSAQQLLVFPNPVSDQLNVHLNNFHHTVRQISLFNITGQEVYRSVPLDTKQYIIPVHQLPEGLYIMSVQTAEGYLSKKVEVLRK